MVIHVETTKKETRYFGIFLYAFRKSQVIHEHIDLRQINFNKQANHLADT